jgi:hypothetical protein
VVNAGFTGLCNTSFSNTCCCRGFGMTKHDSDLTLERLTHGDTQVRVARFDGSEVAVKLRLLGYDGCEFECRETFAVGDRLSIHIYRMGLIRARVIAVRRRIVEAEFVKDCPV